MGLDRRKFLATASGASLTFAAQKSFAFSGCGKNKDGGSIFVGELIDGLRHTLWVPVGPQDREVTIYAVVAPWCPFCTQLTSDAVAGNLNYNVRAIPCEPRGFSDKQKIFNLLSSPSAETISAFHDRRPTGSNRVENPSLFESIIRFQQRTNWAVQEWHFEIFPQLTPGYPIIVVRVTDDDVQTIPGYSEKLSENIARLGSSMPHGNNNVGFEMIRRMSQFTQVNKTAHSRSKSVRLRILPIVDALPTFCLSENHNLHVDGQTRIEGKDWLVNIAVDGSLLFGEASDFTFV